MQEQCQSPGAGFLALPVQSRATLGCGITGRASAEHGSALHFAPSLSRSEEEGWGGVGFGSGRAEPCSAGALPGELLPSMARHYISPPFRAAKGAWGGVGFGSGRAEPCSAGALPGELLPSMARHYISPPPFRAAKGRAGEGVALAVVESSHARLGRYRESFRRARLGTCAAAAAARYSFPTASNPAIAKLCRCATSGCEGLRITGCKGPGRS